MVYFRSKRKSLMKILFSILTSAHRAINPCGVASNPSETPHACFLYFFLLCLSIVALVFIHTKLFWNNCSVIATLSVAMEQQPSMKRSKRITDEEISSNQSVSANHGDSRDLSSYSPFETLPSELFWSIIEYAPDTVLHLRIVSFLRADEYV